MTDRYVVGMEAADLTTLRGKADKRFEGDIENLLADSVVSSAGPLIVQNDEAYAGGRARQTTVERARLSIVQIAIDYCVPVHMLHIYKETDPIELVE